MEIEKEEMSLVFLHEAFNLSKLFSLHETISEIVDEVKVLQSKQRLLGNLTKAVEFEKQLHFLSTNLNNIEVVMLAKESDIMEVICGVEFCKN